MSLGTTTGYISLTQRLRKNERQAYDNSPLAQEKRANCTHRILTHQNYQIIYGWETPRKDHGILCLQDNATTPTFKLQRMKLRKRHLNFFATHTVVQIWLLAFFLFGPLKKSLWDFRFLCVEKVEVKSFLTCKIQSCLNRSNILGETLELTCLKESMLKGSTKDCFKDTTDAFVRSWICSIHFLLTTRLHAKHWRIYSSEERICFILNTKHFRIMFQTIFQIITSSIWRCTYLARREQ